LFRGDKFLGNFKSEVDAAKAYDIEAFNQYGEWAYQNFSESPLPAKQGEKT
jgi:hypothetical protein